MCCSVAKVLHTVSTDVILTCVCVCVQSEVILTFLLVFEEMKHFIWEIWCYYACHDMHDALKAR